MLQAMYQEFPDPAKNTRALRPVNYKGSASILQAMYQNKAYLHALCRVLQHVGRHALREQSPENVNCGHSLKKTKPTYMLSTMFSNMLADTTWENNPLKI